MQTKEILISIKKASEIDFSKDQFNSQLGFLILVVKLTENFAEWSLVYDVVKKFQVSNVKFEHLSNNGLFSCDMGACARIKGSYGLTNKFPKHSTSLRTKFTLSWDDGDKEDLGLETWDKTG